MTVSIEFDQGLLTVTGLPEDLPGALSELKWDARVGRYRAQAMHYRDLVLALRDRGVVYEDRARRFEPIELELVKPIVARPYQKEAARAWREAGRRGVVALPTGAGKTILAVTLIAQTGRPTLVHVPTIDLMHQWRAVLEKYFAIEIGLLGGGYKQLAPITVATYDSAMLHAPTKGDRFGFVVFDECHHLPGDQFQHAARAAIAPFRLGLSATPERNDGRESLLYKLSGDLCYQANIRDLTGGTLAPYQVFTIEVDMMPDERAEYDEAYARYVGFVRRERINFSGPRGWQEFLWKTSRTPEGREAFKAYRRQKQLSQASAAKDGWVWKILQQHRGERIIVFTQDNEMAYRIGRKFLLPVITHQTRPKERERFLQAFRDGEYTAMATSKVLNEGVDVPEAAVAIVVSGSGSVREHVQRLGRVLRGRPGKQALLYELISADTREYHVNQRRKRHHAYQIPGSL